MSLADDLLKIEELHNRGTLSDAEFQLAKAVSFRFFASRVSRFAKHLGADN
jgi:hypothetical protein